MDDKKTFGLLLKEKRKAVKMTQKELAKRLGKVESSVRMWELGKNKPSPETIKEISNILKTDLFDLLSAAGYKELLEEISTEFQVQNNKLRKDFQDLKVLTEAERKTADLLQTIKNSNDESNNSGEIEKLETELEIIQDLKEQVMQSKDIFSLNAFRIQKIRASASKSDLYNVLKFETATFQGMVLSEEEKSDIYEYAYEKLKPRLLEEIKNNLLVDDDLLTKE